MARVSNIGATFFKSKVFRQQSEDFSRLKPSVARRAHIHQKVDVVSSPAPATF
jgi:hypothetical protein